MRHLFLLDPEDLRLQVNSHDIEVIAFITRETISPQERQVFTDLLKIFRHIDFAIYVINGNDCNRLSGFGNPLVVYGIWLTPAVMILDHGKRVMWTEEDGPAVDQMSFPDDADVIISCIDHVLDQAETGEDVDQARAHASFTKLE